MKIYFAPMEGITDYRFRNAYHEFFTDIDRYYTPFIVPHEKRALSNRDIEEIDPEHNRGISLVPQVLTNNAEDFIRLAKEIRDFGYTEVNLNLGCPSGTVVSKGRGAGFLERVEELRVFLTEIFEAEVMDISIKTRLGMKEPEEFEQLLELYNQFPIRELTIHPRVRTDYYKNHPHMESFAAAAQKSKNPLCYNGDIFSKEDYEKLTGKFPHLQAVMLGRGLIANPGLAGEICGGEPVSKKLLREFVNRLYADCKENVNGEKYQLFRMKEYWCYLCYMFEQPEKCWKQLKKTQRLCEYESVVRTMFSSTELAAKPGYHA